MTTLLKAGMVTVTHASPTDNSQIFKAAEAIWGIKSDKLPPAKFDELQTVLLNNLTRKYGPYTVRSMPLDSGNVFIIHMDPKVLATSYKKSPCSLDTCMVTDAAFRCVKCREAMYCSREHQTLDWKRHKVQCLSRK